MQANSVAEVTSESELVVEAGVFSRRDADFIRNSTEGGTQYEVLDVEVSEV